MIEKLSDYNDQTIFIEHIDPIEKDDPEYNDGYYCYRDVGNHLHEIKMPHCGNIADYITENFSRIGLHRLNRNIFTMSDECKYDYKYIDHPLYSWADDKMYDKISNYKF